MECVRVRAGRPRREHSQDERTSPSLCVCVCRCVCVSVCVSVWVILGHDVSGWRVLVSC